MKIYFIRHLKTKGNIEKRYIGSTDESLVNPNEQELFRNFDDTSVIFSSPMKRCVETAKIINRQSEIVIIDNLKEIDFGDFEYKNYDELRDNPEYIKFIENNGMGNIPNGEDISEFKNRCNKAFDEIVELLNRKSAKSAIIVCHGGTIMSVMEKYEETSKPFYDYMVKNGMGYETVFDYSTKTLKIRKELK